MTTPVIIVGAGGFARETAEAVRAVTADSGSLELRGFLDDDRALHGRSLVGGPVLGPVEALSEHPDAAVVVAVGRPDEYTARRRLVGLLDLPVERYATVIHPSTSMGTSCTVGVGSVLLAQCALTADVTVGAHVAVMPHVVLTHDVHVDDFATLASGARLGGGVHVGEGAYVASGACVREGCRIGPWSLVGMGSTVMTDVPTGRVWFGSPARDVRGAPVPDTLLEPQHAATPPVSAGG